mmetsp:Transcript_10084/g.18148  ORF Transcript_10084/g.18148 Transcript_10084/m.18148 type:complete len:112 (+) Transcript_10084:126-461(+)|eukprot:CAMPEP_0201980980 /NCGR_PEP_ID=MMETSP0904-20121228/72065_1 /ASSEMBLY_ACC=CAM_ASM_000553 /TAXON_ID=420261 /ORGANISM="Thalassiosira antarctica, Strain CCMP982" /LENGTH=111 /DNA_ID=CAMNT_0048533423 /DNA_START=23 /DNA_END=358 /DNA_ORIENTATION=-
MVFVYLPTQENPMVFWLENVELALIMNVVQVIARLACDGWSFQTRRENEIPMKGEVICMTEQSCIAWEEFREDIDGFMCWIHTVEKMSCKVIRDSRTAFGCARMGAFRGRK